MLNNNNLSHFVLTMLRYRMVFTINIKILIKIFSINPYACDQFANDVVQGIILFCVFCFHLKPQVTKSLFVLSLFLTISYCITRIKSNSSLHLHHITFIKIFKVFFLLCIFIQISNSSINDPSDLIKFLIFHHKYIHAGTTSS